MFYDRTGLDRTPSFEVHKAVTTLTALDTFLNLAYYAVHDPNYRIKLTQCIILEDNFNQDRWARALRNLELEDCVVLKIPNTETYNPSPEHYVTPSDACWSCQHRIVLLHSMRGWDPGYYRGLDMRGLLYKLDSEINENLRDQFVSKTRRFCRKNDLFWGTTCSENIVSAEAGTIKSITAEGIVLRSEKAGATKTKDPELEWHLK